MTAPVLLDLLDQRASVRDFTSDPVPQDLLETVLRAALRAPTSFNFQPYSFVVVRDPVTRGELAEIGGGQPHVRSAPVLLVVCADLARVRRWCGFDPEADPTADPDLLVACVTDAALAGMCASLAAESLGLGTVMIGGIRNDPGRVAELLHLPPGVLATFAICVGRPAVRPAARPRLDPGLCVHTERYDEKSALLAADYQADGLQLPDAGPLSPNELANWRDQLVKGARRARRMAPKASLNS